VTFHSTRSTWTATALAFLTALLVSSCGGGGAASGSTGGTLSILPATGTLYAGVPTTFQILGGQPTYSISSSEPTVLPVPSSTKSNSFTVLPQNPGVIDTGLAAGALPVRTVTITVRDGIGQSVTASVQVGQNFMVGGYNVVVSNNCATASSGTATSNVVCAGTSAIQFLAVTNGTLQGAREFKMDVVFGNFTLTNPATGQTGTSIGVTSDHNGTVSALINVPAGSLTQVGDIRLTDVATGASVFHLFTIQGPSSTTQLTALPASFTFTGPDSATCGTGSGDFFVFDGAPPYNAFSSDPNITVTYIDPNHNPGHFRITVANGGATCANGAVVVTDAGGARTSVTVTSAKGTTAPTVPPTPIQVVPNTLTLGCGQSASVSVLGGNQASGGGGGGGGGSSSSISASSSNPNVTISNISGNTVTILRGGTGAGSGGTTTSNVVVTDGATSATVAVTSPTNCP
jgi:hypothetical protein